MGHRQRHGALGHGYASKEIAEKVLAKITSDITTGKAGLLPNPKDVPTLAKLAEPWLERREKTHRSADMDRCRWNKHLKQHFGERRPSEIDAAAVRQFIEAKLESKLSSTTVLLCVRMLSAFFSDLVERGLVPTNPMRSLPRATRRLIRPAHDPRTTPFLEKLDDVRQVYRALPEPLHAAFAVGAFGGLRTGEAFALKWSNVDLDGHRIRVRESVGGPLKDDEARVVPILDSLYPALRAWKEKSGGTGLLAPSMRRAKHIDSHTPG